MCACTTLERSPRFSDPLLVGDTVDDKGMRQVFFHMNGTPRTLEVPDRKAQSIMVQRERVEPGNKGVFFVPIMMGCCVGGGGGCDDVDADERVNVCDYCQRGVSFAFAGVLIGFLCSRERIALLVARGSRVRTHLTVWNRSSCAYMAIAHVGAPMQGDLVELSVKPGDVVVAGQKLVVLSAMKMEMAIGAPYSGAIKRVLVSKGDNLSAGDLILEFEPVYDPKDAQ
jgi:pyruvate carboxylase